MLSAVLPEALFGSESKTNPRSIIGFPLEKLHDTVR